MTTSTAATSKSNNNETQDFNARNLKLKKHQSAPTNSYGISQQSFSSSSLSKIKRKELQYRRNSITSSVATTMTNTTVTNNNRNNDSNYSVLSAFSDTPSTYMNTQSINTNNTNNTNTRSSVSQSLQSNNTEKRSSTRVLTNAERRLHGLSTDEAVALAYNSRLALYDNGNQLCVYYHYYYFFL